MESLHHNLAVLDTGFLAHDMVPITILSLHEPESTNNATIGLYSIDSEVQNVLKVLIQPCYLSFIFSNASNRNHHLCECSAEIQANEIPCDPDSGIITVRSGFWVGNVTANKIAVSPCYARYCLYGTKTSLMETLTASALIIMLELSVQVARRITVSHLAMAAVCSAPTIFFSP